MKSSRSSKKTPSQAAPARKQKAPARKKVTSARKTTPKKKTKTTAAKIGTTKKKPTAPRTKATAAKKKTTAARKKRPAVKRSIANRENATLLNLENLLQQRIVGKDEAIKRVADAIRIRRTNLDFKPHRPDGSFLIVGPPGVGKTEFPVAVAEVLLGSDTRVINLDMADYTMEEDVEDLLVTAYPGTDGILVEGALTTPVRKNPKSVILLRGIERAHPSILRLLLHILERGILNDAQGEACFNETIIFATTRLAFDEAELVEQIGFTRSSTPREERCRRILEEQFTPELIAAFNDVLYFHSLTPQDVKLIARYKVNAVLERLQKQKRGVVISDAVWETFIREHEVRKAGARYLNRTLEEKLFTPLSKYLLEHDTARRICVDVQNNHLVINHAKP